MDNQEQPKPFARVLQRMKDEPAKPKQEGPPRLRFDDLVRSLPCRFIIVAEHRYHHGGCHTVDVRRAEGTEVLALDLSMKSVLHHTIWKEMKRLGRETSVGLLLKAEKSDRCFTIAWSVSDNQD